jgi:hypothetical protein
MKFNITRWDGTLNMPWAYGGDLWDWGVQDGPAWTPEAIASVEQALNGQLAKYIKDDIEINVSVILQRTSPGHFGMSFNPCVSFGDISMHRWYGPVLGKYQYVRDSNGNLIPNPDYAAYEAALQYIGNADPKIFRTFVQILKQANDRNDTPNKLINKLPTKDTRFIWNETMDFYSFGWGVYPSTYAWTLNERSVPVPTMTSAQLKMLGAKVGYDLVPQVNANSFAIPPLGIASFPTYPTLYLQGDGTDCIINICMTPDGKWPNPATSDGTSEILGWQGEDTITLTNISIPPGGTISLPVNDGIFRVTITDGTDGYTGYDPAHMPESMAGPFTYTVGSNTITRANVSSRNTLCTVTITPATSCYTFATASSTITLPYDLFCVYITDVLGNKYYGDISGGAYSGELTFDPYARTVSLIPSNVGNAPVPTGELVRVAYLPCEYIGMHFDASTMERYTMGEMRSGAWFAKFMDYKNAPGGAIDFQSTIIHEVIHGMGPMTHGAGGSQFAFSPFTYAMDLYRIDKNDALTMNSLEKFTKAKRRVLRQDHTAPAGYDPSCQTKLVYGFNEETHAPLMVPASDNLTNTTGHVQQEYYFDADHKIVCVDPALQALPDNAPLPTLLMGNWAGGCEGTLRDNMFANPVSTDMPFLLKGALCFLELSGWSIVKEGEHEHDHEGYSDRKSRRRSHSDFHEDFGLVTFATPAVKHKQKDFVEGLKKHKIGG